MQQKLHISNQQSVMQISTGAPSPPRAQQEVSLVPAREYRQMMKDHPSPGYFGLTSFMSTTSDNRYNMVVQNTQKPSITVVKTASGDRRKQFRMKLMRDQIKK